MAPEDMRGRYMAVFGFTWMIPMTFGVLLAGLIMDNGDPRWVWYCAGLVGLAASAAFALLQRRVDRFAADAGQAAEPVAPARRSEAHLPAAGT
jgi:MFS family permease